jgi:hypothetical protein
MQRRTPQQGASSQSRQALQSSQRRRRRAAIAERAKKRLRITRCATHVHPGNEAVTCLAGRVVVYSPDSTSSYVKGGFFHGHFRGTLEKIGGGDGVKVHHRSLAQDRGEARRSYGYPRLAAVSDDGKVQTKWSKARHHGHPSMAVRGMA